MNTKILGIGVVIVLIAALAGWYFMGPGDQQAAVQQSREQQQVQPTQQAAESPQQAEEPATETTEPVEAAEEPAMQQTAGAGPDDEKVEQARKAVMQAAEVACASNQAMCGCVKEQLDAFTRTQEFATAASGGPIDPQKMQQTMQNTMMKCASQ